MHKAEIIKSLIKDKGYSIKSFAEKCGLPVTSLYTIFKRTGISRAGYDVVNIICKNLDITPNDLNRMASGYNLSTDHKSFDELNILLAKNYKKLTIEEKQLLIRTLLSDD